MSKPTKHAKRALKRAQRLEKHIDGIISVLAEQAQDEVVEAERMMAELEMEVALLEAQSIPMEARH
ncbi:hypothetical protein [Burkholderia ubonensis]|uniref:hypothetical protein n=1 Tax=Burkholderia ubonensis TaxID=101571 RepID=UPI000756134C|nr:hypothetical protein [Burkholderia ubonensis]KWN15862.1 hypothetical protein WM21_11850 [Burkholderia ubonensis]